MDDLKFLYNANLSMILYYSLLLSFFVVEMFNRKGTEQLKGKTSHRLRLSIPAWFAPILNIKKKKKVLKTFKKLCVCEKKDGHRSQRKRMIRVQLMHEGRYLTYFQKYFRLRTLGKFMLLNLLQTRVCIYYGVLPEESHCTNIISDPVV